ncbi:MAG: hypothetical protein PWR24_292 [Desulfonauticus sp.]|jgi:uncharacterized radical SAM protein YgiQ|nr:hypothetical protein [Desulfonauticus sp.]
MFIPISKEELKKLNWPQPDIILVTGDAYIDSSFIGVALLGKFLIKHGYKVALIPQPDWKSGKDITRLGEPRLFWGVTAGSVDSMVANYTAIGKKRKTDDYTPGGINNKRPDRASIVYTNLIRRYFKNTKPIVLGGIEASLRRIAHYDFWSDSLRRSILFDAKADYLLYGMAEYSLLELTRALEQKQEVTSIRGLCYIAKEKPASGIELPSYEEVKADKEKFTQMFLTFYQNQDPVKGQRLIQKHQDRYLVHNPPYPALTQEQMDEIYSLSFENKAHPLHQKQGKIKALETIQFSITTHRGCYGECHFCAISMHQGKIIQSRSEKSILAEVKSLIKHPDFKGIIQDLGGPTANMYGFECNKKLKKGSCSNKRCLFPQPCPNLPLDHTPQINLLRKVRKIPGVKKVFVNSGLRYDLILADKRAGETYLQDLVSWHVSGQLKIAPEHVAKEVLEIMGKPDNQNLLEFKRKFDELSKKKGKKQFLTYYFIAAHPGCTEKHMYLLKKFALDQLKINPRQIQIFTPTPSTFSTLMYFTEKNPFTGQKIKVAKTFKDKQKQKDIVLKRTKKRETQKI